MKKIIKDFTKEIIPEGLRDFDTIDYITLEIAKRNKQFKKPLERNVRTKRNKQRRKERLELFNYFRLSDNPTYLDRTLHYLADLGNGYKKRKLGMKLLKYCNRSVSGK